MKIVRESAPAQYELVADGSRAVLYYFLECNYEMRYRK